MIKLSKIRGKMDKTRSELMKFSINLKKIW